MKQILILSMMCLVFISSNAQQKKIWNETENEKTERMAWWTEARFCLFDSRYTNYDIMNTPYGKYIIKE